MDADLYYQQCRGELYRMLAKGDNEIFMITEGKIMNKQ